MIEFSKRLVIAFVLLLIAAGAQAQDILWNDGVEASGLTLVGKAFYTPNPYDRIDAALHNGESSTTDGIHPNDNGYSIWERSIEKPILKILRKYGINNA